MAKTILDVSRWRGNIDCDKVKTSGKAYYDALDAEDKANAEEIAQ